MLSIRSVPGASDSLADEVHRTLVYYLDKLAPQGESGPEPQLETVLLIGAPLSVSDVKTSCQTLFPPDCLPAVCTLRDVDRGSWIVDRGSSRTPTYHESRVTTLEAIAGAAGLAAMGL